IQPGERYDTTREPMPEKLEERSFFERYLTPPTPPPPPETQTALLYWLMRDTAFRRALQDTYVMLALGQMGLSVEAKLLLPAAIRCSMPESLRGFMPEQPDQLLLELAGRLAGTHPLPLASQILAVREARRGVLSHPNEAIPHLMLGMAYTTLPALG